MNINVTVRDFLDYIKKNNIPYDTELFYQRIDDRYFEGIDISGMIGCKDTPDRIYPPGSKSEGWPTTKIKGENYYAAIEYNKHVEEGKLVKEGKLDSDEVGRFFWDEKYKDSQKPIDLSDEGLLDQYVGAENIFYDRENKIMCITAHI